MLRILSYIISFIMAILLVPLVLLLKLGSLLKIPAADRLQNKLSDTYSADKDVRIALSKYGFRVGHNGYTIANEVTLSPDKFAYVLSRSKHDKQVLIFLIEDYVQDLEYIKNSFVNDFDAKIVTLHTVENAFKEASFDKRLAVKAASTYNMRPDDWQAVCNFAVDFPPYYFGFLATVELKNSNHV